MIKDSCIRQQQCVTVPLPSNTKGSVVSAVRDASQAAYCRASVPRCDAEREGGPTHTSASESEPNLDLGSDPTTSCRRHYTVEHLCELIKNSWDYTPNRKELVYGHFFS